MNTVIIARTNRTGWLCRDSISISSLLQNPESGQMPARLSEPMRKVAYVHGITLRRPPIRRISNVPVAWFTLPAPRNSSALKKAWLNRWNMPTATPPAPSPSIM